MAGGMERSEEALMYLLNNLKGKDTNGDMGRYIPTILTTQLVQLPPRHHLGRRISHTSKSTLLGILLLVRAGPPAVSQMPVSIWSFALTTGNMQWRL